MLEAQRLGEIPREFMAIDRVWSSDVDYTGDGLRHQLQDCPRQIVDRNR